MMAADDRSDQKLHAGMAEREKRRASKSEICLRLME